MPKSLVYYHRAYRKITGSGWVFLGEFLLVTIPLVLLILYYYPHITRLMSVFTQYVLTPYFAPGAVYVTEKTFLIGNVSIVNAPGTYPSSLMSLINFLVALSLMIALPYARKLKNIAIFLVFLAAIHMISGLFFTLVPYDFPYTAAEFSELYVKSEISMWIFIPFILAMAFLPLPAPILPKIILMIVTLLYSVIFGTLRYVIFLYVIGKFSFIYMALLFFAFGPLIDFVYIVGIYSFYTSNLAKKLKGSESVWKWLY